MFEKSIYQGKVEKMKQKSIEDDTYYLMGSTFATLALKHGNYGIFDFFEDWDTSKRVPLDLGLMLEEMVMDPNSSLGIHRTEIFGDPLENDMLDNILTNGLYNFGDLSSGAYSKNIPPTKTVSFPKSILNTMITLKTSYKSSNVAILFSFPSDIVDKDGDAVLDDYEAIYNEVGGNLIIKPEFIKGVVVQYADELMYFDKEELLNKLSR